MIRIPKRFDSLSEPGNRDAKIVTSCPFLTSLLAISSVKVSAPPASGLAASRQFRNKILERNASCLPVAFCGFHDTMCTNRVLPLEKDEPEIVWNQQQRYPCIARASGYHAGSLRRRETAAHN